MVVAFVDEIRVNRTLRLRNWRGLPYFRSAIYRVDIEAKETSAGERKFSALPAGPRIAKATVSPRTRQATEEWSGLGNVGSRATVDVVEHRGCTEVGPVVWTGSG